MIHTRYHLNQNWYLFICPVVESCLVFRGRRNCYQSSFIKAVKTYLSRCNVWCSKLLNHVSYADNQFLKKTYTIKYHLLAMNYEFVYRLFAVQFAIPLLYCTLMPSHCLLHVFLQAHPVHFQWQLLTVDHTSQAQIWTALTETKHWSQCTVGLV